jgi:hypothetical protein
MADARRQDAQSLSDDIVVVEGRDASRSVVGACGHYTLGHGPNRNGKARKLQCRIVKMSPDRIEVAVPISGSVGDWVVANFGMLGRFEGPVIQVLQRSLVMRIVATNEDRARIAVRIAWINSGRPDVRRFPRLLPESPGSTVSLPTGQRFSCRVIDYSVGGAAMSAEFVPTLGAIVKLGSVVGRVVRHFSGGFAVTFPTLQDPQSIESLILQPIESNEPG